MPNTFLYTLGPTTAVATGDDSMVLLLLRRLNND
jgi:hypothetical protein